MHVWKRGSADTNSCSQPLLSPSTPPPIFNHSLRFFFLLMPRQQLMMLPLGAGISRALLTLSPQMKAECIYSAACHPAASGRGITLATMNRRGLIQKQALARWLTATQAGLTTLSPPRYIAACVYNCVFVFGSCTFIKSSEAWIGCRVLVENILFPKLSRNFSGPRSWMNCLLDAGADGCWFTDWLGVLHLQD